MNRSFSGRIAIVTGLEWRLGRAYAILLVSV